MVPKKARCRGESMEVIHPRAEGARGIGPIRRHPGQTHREVSVQAARRCRRAISVVRAAQAASGQAWRKAISAAVVASEPVVLQWQRAISAAKVASVNLARHL